MLGTVALEGAQSDPRFCKRSGELVRTAGQKGHFPGGSIM